ncbi:MAG: S8 family peptidase [Armatimonadota bacterium]
MKVAIVDTGVAYNAPDLSGTKFDLVYDWDFVNWDDDAYDDNGHGTHVCGTVAQTTNNNEGCAGIAYGATILPVKVLDASGSGYYSWVASGIRLAADKGAKVINLSLGGTFPSSTLKSAVDYAASKDCVVVAAAGNNGANSTLYPAKYTNCVAVGATNFYGRRAWYSNYGKDIDVVAPGGDLRYGTYHGIVQQTFDASGWIYGWWQGTSMATPHVSGVAVLVRSYNPSLTASDTRKRIQTYGIAPANPREWSNRYVKIVNAYGAVTGTNP